MEGQNPQSNNPKQLKESIVKLKEETIKEYYKFLPHIKKYGFLLLLLIPILLNFYLRIQAVYLPVTDNWARDTLLNNLRNDVTINVNNQYPNLPAPNKEGIINQQISQVLSQNKGQFDTAIGDLSSQFKATMQDDNGITYLIGIDPYFWTRYARNILKNGHPGDSLTEKSKPYDDHMLAPFGRPIPPDMFHAYFLAYSYKITKLVNSDVTLESVTVYNPAVLMGLAVLIVFFLGRKIGGNITGFFASTIVAIHNYILVRTVGGFSDTDPYQIIFPSLIILLFVESFRVQSKITKVLMPVLTGAVIGFYPFAWGGAWYIYLYVISAGAIYLLYHAYEHWRSTKHIKGMFNGTQFSRTFLIFSMIMITSILSTLIFSGPQILIEISDRVIGFVKIHEVGESYIWPNVYITVAEQNEGTITSAILGMGGKFIFYFSILGIVLPLLFRKIREDNNIDFRYPIILTIWLLTTLWAVTRGIRFTLMVVPPFAIGFGLMLTIIPIYIKKSLKFLNIDNKIYRSSATIVLFIVGLSLLGMIPGQDNGIWPISKGIATHGSTDMNDAWWAALEKIRLNADKDAIITSWWDFGHWFKYIADRRVTFDGTSQNNPQAHWVGKILLDNDERHAVGILRMLDCGANTGFEKLNEAVGDTAMTRDIIDPMFKMSRAQAKEYLTEVSKRYPNSIFETDVILNYTHCNPPETYFIASNDMIYKAGVWGHFGLWDFNKSLMYYDLTRTYPDDAVNGINFLQERFGMSEQDAQQTYYEIITFDSPTANTWIATWPGYQSINSRCTEYENRTILDCSNNIKFNLSQLPYSVLINNNPNLTPYSLVYPAGNSTGELIYSDNMDFSLVLYETPDNSINYLIANKNLANGMFTKMFFMSGYGLQYFEPFDYRKGISDTTVYVYKVNWNKLMEEENGN